MSHKIGIDIEGTFTDIVAISGNGSTGVNKTLSTPEDPSIGFINELREVAEMNNLSFENFID